MLGLGECLPIGVLQLIYLQRIGKPATLMVSRTHARSLGTAMTQGHDYIGHNYICQSH